MKQIHKAEKQTLNFKKLERERLVLSQQRIRGPGYTYSEDELWGTLTAKLLREHFKKSDFYEQKFHKKNDTK